MQVALVIITAFIGLTLQCAMVGACLALYELRTGRVVSRWISFPALLFIFACLQTYFLPAIAVSDASITIRQEDVARYLGTTPDMPLMQLFKFSVIDLVTLTLEATLAIWFARRFSQVVVAEAPGRLQDYLFGWPIVVVLLVTVSSSFWTYRLVEYVLIHQVYGSDAWNSGLRVVGKHGHLTDGRDLSDFHQFVLDFGSYLLSVPFFLGSAYGCAHMNRRMHAKRQLVAGTS
jgi:hypothetical protein